MYKAFTFMWVELMFSASIALDTLKYKHMFISQRV